MKKMAKDVKPGDLILINDKIGIVIISKWIKTHYGENWYITDMSRIYHHCISKESLIEVICE